MPWAPLIQNVAMADGAMSRIGVKMKRGRLAVLVIATVSAAASSSEAFGAEDQPVNTRLKLVVPGKVQSVTWSIQRDLCAIQINFPSVQDGEKEPQHARTQVWLLRPDGTIVPRTSKSPELRAIGISNAGWVTYFVSYTFPVSARTEALAVAIQIDDELFIERVTANSK
jgi:hypothetical protein